MNILKTEEMIKFFSLIIIISSITTSCNKNEQQDEKIKNKSLFNDYLDTIEKSEPVFLSFYPEMSHSEFLDQVYIERDKKNLYISSEPLKYIFVIDTIKTIIRFPGFLSSFDNKVAMYLSKEDNSIDLTSSSPIYGKKYEMIKKIYSKKYGKIKDTVLPFLWGKYLESDNKIIFLNIRDNSVLRIQYFSKKSFQKETQDYYNRIRRDSIMLIESKKEELEKNEKLKSEMLELI